jgi:hypothetical protein
MKKGIVLLLLPFMGFLASCNTTGVFSPVSDIDEIVHIQSDRLFYEHLGQIEDAADLIVEAVPQGITGQNVNTTYHRGFGKFLPDFGYTRREIEVAKVYKGDVNPGDTLTLLEGYYIWTTEGKKQLISRSPLMPAQTNETYLFFLQYSEAHEGYWPVGDYQGRYAVSSGEITAKAKSGTLKQADLDVYQHEHLPYLIPIYREVAQKYFPGKNVRQQ